MTTSLQAAQAISDAPPRQATDACAPGRAVGPAPLAPSTAPAALWQAVLADLERNPAISRANFATWLRGTQLLEAEGGEFTVGAQHTFALEKLERSFRGAIELALGQHTGTADARVRFVVARTGNVPRTHGAAPRPLPLKSGEDEGRTAGPNPIEGTKDESVRSYPVELDPEPLNRNWAFETFAVGRHNQFAYAAAYAVADNPSFAYNPLVMFGPPGAGKTHLLHAIGQRVLALRAGAHVAYVPARAIAAAWLRCGADAATFAAYREQYAHMDVLLLDGLHVLPALGPVGTGLQLEIVRLVAGLLRADAQVVVASQQPPRTLSGLEEALRSRLQTGLIAELGPRERPVPVRATIWGTDAADPAATRRRIAPDHVLDAVAAYFGLPVQALQAKRRDKEAVLPRHVAMYLMREETGASFSDIGARLGGRDHSTVLHGCEKVASRLAGDPALQADVAAVRQRLAAVASSGAILGAAAAAAAAP